MIGSDKKRVLVVSEDGELREDVSYSFPNDYQVILANDAREALRMMNDRRPVVAIVDIQTGSAGGFSLAREMRSVKELADVPVVMLLERNQDSWLARQSGARLWRTKPIKGSALANEAVALITS